MRSPVLLLVFNRPGVTARVLEAIRQARPPRLYVAADGPRPHKEGEAELCGQVRALATAVDWPCEVSTLFRKRNLGCGVAVSSAITWFFQQEHEGVILEDDVLPHPDFFRYCDTLLEIHRDNPRIMHISGDNFQLGLRRGEASYYFSTFTHVWGWASWARAWKHFDLGMPGLSGLLREGLPGLIAEEAGREHVGRELQRVKQGKLDTWDYPWSYAVLRQGGLCTMPNHSLVRNLGFGSGTHCVGPDIWAHLEAHPMPDILHPMRVEADAAADLFTSRVAFAPGGSLPGPLLAEGFRRLGAGEAYANPELLRMLRACYGGSCLADQLEALSWLYMGKKEEALRKAASLAVDWPKDADAADMGRAIVHAVRCGLKFSAPYHKGALQ